MKSPEKYTEVSFQKSPPTKNAWHIEETVLAGLVPRELRHSKQAGFLGGRTHSRLQLNG